MSYYTAHMNDECRNIEVSRGNDHFSVCLQCGSLQLCYLPLALEGAELIIWEELERIELRLEEEGLGCKTECILNITKTIKALIWNRKDLYLSYIFYLADRKPVLKKFMCITTAAFKKAG